MISLKIICVGKIKDKNLEALIDEYKKRVTKYTKLEIIELEDEKINQNISQVDIEFIKEKESNKIIEKLDKLNKAYVIALDLKGKMISSEEFSRKFKIVPVNGYSTIVFIIGGSLGMSKKLLDLCNEKLCFSTLTFPHQLIRLFLCEQIFRAFKIIHNETYHH